MTCFIFRHHLTLPKFVGHQQNVQINKARKINIPEENSMLVQIWFFLFCMKITFPLLKTSTLLKDISRPRSTAILQGFQEISKIDMWEEICLIERDGVELEPNVWFTSKDGWKTLDRDRTCWCFPKNLSVAFCGFLQYIID